MIRGIYVDIMSHFSFFGIPMQHVLFRHALALNIKSL